MANTPVNRVSRMKSYNIQTIHLILLIFKPWRIFLKTGAPVSLICRHAGMHRKEKQSIRQKTNWSQREYRVSHLKNTSGKTGRKNTPRIAGISGSKNEHPIHLINIFKYLGVFGITKRRYRQKWPVNNTVILFLYLKEMGFHGRQRNRNQEVHHQIVCFALLKR